MRFLLAYIDRRLTARLVFAALCLATLDLLGVAVIFPYLSVLTVEAPGEGAGLAMGAFLVLAGDYRIGVEGGDHRITANEVAIGLTLPRAALEICRQRLSSTHFERATLLAEVFDPAGALEAGWLDELVPEPDLLAAAQAAGVPHIVAQSYGSWNGIRRGGWVKTEEEPTDPAEGTPAHVGFMAMRHVEERVVSVGGAALRYGWFYGPGAMEGLVTPVRKRQFPVVGGGTGHTSSIHLDDAAARAAGFPGVIAHGMSVIAVVCEEAIDRYAASDASRVRSVGGRFSAPVIPEEPLAISFQTDATDGTVRFTCKTPGGLAVKQGWVQVR